MRKPNSVADVSSTINESADLKAHPPTAERTNAETLTLLETLLATAPIGFGFVDRDLRVVRLNEILATVNGSSVEAQIGQLVADVVGPKYWPQLEPIYRGVLESGKAVLDVEVDGPSASDPGQMHYWLTSYYPVTLRNKTIGIGIIVADITERKLAEQARVSLSRAVIDTVAATVEARDPYTAGHQDRVASISTALAVELGLDANAIEGIDVAARIHDIGKLRIPAEILTRPGELLDSERELIKIHPSAGAEIVKGIDFGWPIAEMIEQHHERIDGSGYPKGLQGDQICLGARIIAVADTLDAMAAARPYRTGLGTDAAFAEIVGQRGKLYDSAVVDACIRLVETRRIDLGDIQQVLLST